MRSDDREGSQRAREAVRLCGEAGLTLATAESLTGGLVAAAITDVPGASASFRGGAVTYATDSKVSLLGVPQQIIAEHGAVHSTTAAAMARHARMIFECDIGLATTGVAGPDELEGKAPGTVFIGVDVHGGPARVERLQLSGDRAAVRAQATDGALILLCEVLESMAGRE